MRRKTYTRFAVIALWALLTNVQIQELVADAIPCDVDTCIVDNPAPGCGCRQYLDAESESCKTCTDCCTLEQLEVQSCSQLNDTVCTPCVEGSEFFNSETKRCQACSVCTTNERKTADCTIEEDTQCVARCPDHQYYVPEMGGCIINCGLCQHGCTTSGTARCECRPSHCYADTDVLCEHNICTTTSAPPSGDPTEQGGGGSNNLPTWGIGLISIGVVIGIVAFSAGSMILSFCTRNTSQIIEEGVETTNESKPVFVDQYVNGHPNPFLHHHSLETNRYAPRTTCKSFRSGSIRTNSIRNSPKALRTVQVPRMENATPI